MRPESTPVSAGPGPGPQAGARQPDDAQPSGYTVVLPPGWHQIPVREGTNEAIKKIVDKTFAQPPEGVPRDKLTPYRIELERRLSAAAAQARRNGGVHLYLPVTMRYGTPIAASFVVSEGSLGSLEDINPEMIISYLASSEEPAEDGSRMVTVDGAVGLRREHTAPASPEKEIDYGSRRVDYVLPVPSQHDRWLVIAFSTLGGGDPDDDYSAILVELFDAIITTFRWTRGQQPAAGEAP